MEDKIGFSLAVGVKDEATTRGCCFDGFAAKTSAMGTKDKNGFYKIASKGDPTIFVGVAAKQFVITTDAKLGGRLRDGKKGNLTSRGESRGVAAPDDRIGAIRGVSPGTWRRFCGSRSRSAVASTPWRKAADGEPRTSKEIRRLEKKLAKLEARIDKARDAKDAAELRELLKVVDAVGMQVYTLSEDGHKVTLRGTHTLGTDSWASVVAAVADTAQAMKDPPRGAAPRQAQGRAPRPPPRARRLALQEGGTESASGRRLGDAVVFEAGVDLGLDEAEPAIAGRGQEELGVDRVR